MNFDKWEDDLLACVPGGVCTSHAPGGPAQLRRTRWGQPRCGAAANTPVQVAGAGAGQEAAPGLGAALELPGRAAASL